MANDCLVTRLKGTVQNDNLPILNTIRINLLAAGLRIGTEETILIGTGNSAVEIKSQVPFHIGSASNPAVTQYTIPMNYLQNIVFTSSDMPSGAVDNAVTISGGVYDLTSLVYYWYCGWFKINGADYTTLGYAEDLVNQVCTSEIEALDNVEILCIDDKDAGNNVRTYPNILPSTKTSVKILWGIYIDNVMATPIIDKNTLAKMPNLEHLNMRFYGNIKDIPLNVKVLYKPSSSTTGTLEEFVADRRSKGETSGVIAFNTPQYTWVVTYNGVAIKDMSQGERPIIDNWSYFVWDASSMGFASSVPAGFKVYSSLFGATQDAINGVL